MTDAFKRETDARPRELVAVSIWIARDLTRERRTRNRLRAGDAAPHRPRRVARRRSATT